MISDWEALDRFHDPHGSNYRSSVLSAVNAGIDMVHYNSVDYTSFAFYTSGFKN